MRRQSGISQVAIAAALAAVAVLAAGGAGFAAWQGRSELESFQKEVSASRTSLSKALADGRKMSSELATSSKEAKDAKTDAERLTVERDSLRVATENAQAVNAQLRTELEAVREQVAYLASRSSKEIVRGMPKAPASK